MYNCYTLTHCDETHRIVNCVTATITMQLYRCWFVESLNNKATFFMAALKRFIVIGPLIMHASHRNFILLAEYMKTRTLHIASLLYDFMK